MRRGEDGTQARVLHPQELRHLRLRVALLRRRGTQSTQQRTRARLGFVQQPFGEALRAKRFLVPAVATCAPVDQLLRQCARERLIGAEGLRELHRVLKRGLAQTLGDPPLECEVGIDALVEEDDPLGA